MLSELAEIYVKAGIEPGKIAHEIVKATGMSYRWVMKYLVDGFKSDLILVAGKIEDII